MAEATRTRESEGKAPGMDRTGQAKAVIVSLLRSADAVRRHMGNVVSRHDLTLQQFNVLRILRGAGPDPLPTMTIAERMIEKTPGVTRFLDNLEDRGLIVRKRCTDDRRRVHAWITQAGLQLLAEMDDDVEAADLGAIRGLADGDVNSLVDLLSVIQGNVEGRE